MRHNKNHDNARSAGSQLVPVHFEFTHPTVHRVSVAGNFNNWQPEACSGGNCKRPERRSPGKMANQILMKQQQTTAPGRRTDADVDPIPV